MQTSCLFVFTGAALGIETIQQLQPHQEEAEWALGFSRIWECSLSLPANTAPLPSFVLQNTRVTATDFLFLGRCGVFLISTYLEFLFWVVFLAWSPKKEQGEARIS